MLPPLDAEIGSLPPGVHLASWQEVVNRFGWNERRRAILSALLEVALNLKGAGCKCLYLDGSLVTSKEHPKDFDACCDHEGIDHDLVDPLLKQGVEVMRRAFGGEIQPASWRATPELTFLEFFQLDTRTSVRKGIVRIDLATLPAIVPPAPK